MFSALSTASLSLKGWPNRQKAATRYLKFKYTNLFATGDMPRRTPRQLFGVDAIRPNAILNAVLNPFQTQRLCFCQIRKTNRTLFQDRSNEYPIQQYQTRWMHSRRNTCHRFKQVHPLEASSPCIFHMEAPSQPKIFGLT
jgi:hypothetical protein